MPRTGNDRVRKLPESLPCNSRFDVIHYFSTTEYTDGALGCESNTRRRNGVRSPARGSL